MSEDMNEKYELVVPLSERVRIKRKCERLALEILQRKGKP